MEINHSRMKGDDFERAREIAKKFDFIMSGGSDFHRLGRFELGQYGLSQEEFEKLEKGFKDEYIY